MTPKAQTRSATIPEVAGRRTRPAIRASPRFDTGPARAVNAIPSVGREKAREPRRRNLPTTAVAEPVGAVVELDEGLINRNQLSFQGLDQSQHLGPFRGGSPRVGEPIAELEIRPQIATLRSTELLELANQLLALFLQGCTGTVKIHRCTHLLRGWDVMYTSYRCWGDTRVYTCVVVILA